MDINIIKFWHSSCSILHVKAKRVVATAVLTDEEFDATLADPARDSSPDPPVRQATEDVDGDGKIDMLLHFKVQEADLCKQYKFRNAKGGETG